ncbi:MAG: pre-peptidase C-terminal domain-containing protein [Anaerolineae bacterium]|nr:pre-peptidase C-terminal domain-containing protein [Anaerolineae bacterium]
MPVTMFRSVMRLLPVALLLVLVSMVVAQGEARVLTPDTPATGVLDADNVAQVFRFDANEGDVVRLSATSASGLGLAVLLSDANGDPVAQAFEMSGTTVLEDISLPRTETYYVTVLSSIGVTLPADSSFELTLEVEAATPDVVGVAATPTPEETAEATPEVTPEVTEEPAATATAVPTSVPQTSFAPGEILISTALDVQLTWNSEANLDLEVRDPVGGSLRFATPNVDSGGTFGVNVNSVCNTASANAPTEQASWPAGALPTGSYELLIYYQPIEDCPTTEPVSFTLDVTLDGQALAPITGSLLPDETYLASFVVGNDASLTAGANGLYTDTTTLPLPVEDMAANPQPIARDVVVEGIITSGNYYQVYSFEGIASDIITISMNATSGSLDTLLLLLDSDGNIVDSSDDRAQGVTDAQILNLRLFEDDTYTVIATRYGKDVGGTEGGYELLLTGPSGDLPQEVLDLGLPRGAIEVSLTWNTNADLQLLVRDPRGDSVYDDSISVASGGQLAADGNVNCVPAQTSPVSYIYWPEGALTPGLYEIEVLYQNQCNDTRSVNFNLTIRVDGQTVFADTANPTPDEWYVTSFVLDVNRNVTMDGGGFIGTRQRLNSLAIDYLPELPSAQPIESGQTLNGSITPDNKFDLYTFDAQAGDVVTISMIRNAGNLDTTLFLLDSNGSQVTFNDDVVPGDNTDSLISEFTLPQDGEYVIIATHFGLSYGGTTGTYSLAFSRLNE